MHWRIFNSITPKLGTCVGCVDDAGRVYDTQDPVDLHCRGFIDQDGQVFRGVSQAVWDRRVGAVKNGSLYDARQGAGIGDAIGVVDTDGCVYLLRTNGTYDVSTCAGSVSETNVLTMGAALLFLLDGRLNQHDKRYAYAWAGAAGSPAASDEHASPSEGTDVAGSLLEALDSDGPLQAIAVIAGFAILMMAEEILEGLGSFLTSPLAWGALAAFLGGLLIRWLVKSGNERESARPQIRESQGGSSGAMTSSHMGNPAAVKPTQPVPQSSGSATKHEGTPAKISTLLVEILGWVIPGAVGIGIVYGVVNLVRWLGLPWWVELVVGALLLLFTLVPWGD